LTAPVVHPSRAPMRTLRLALALLAGLAVACGGKPARQRIIVLGVDGVDPRTVDLLMSEGKLPNFAKLREDGAYARLLSSEPMLSPILWTTIATGKRPEQHGIGHFVAVNPQSGEELPVTSQMRRTKALWNLLSEQGRRVAVVGWWATWPAETVNGTIVSDHACYHFLFPDGVAGGRTAVGSMFPAEAEAELAPMIRRPGDVTFEEASRFVDVSPEEFARPFDFNDDLGHFKWALATADSYRRIGLHLWEHERPDLLMVYIEGVDTTSHLFGHLFRAQGLAGELADQQRRFGRTVEEMYRYVDGVVGDFMRALDDRSTLVVLSDHGFELGAVPDDPSKTRDMRRVSERYHRAEGIVYLFGSHVKRHTRPEKPKLLDVTPTVLALAGLPPAQDMPGRVWIEAVDVTDPPRSIASYEAAERHAGAPATDAAVDPAILTRLRSLGYVGAESPKGERNLAAVHFQAGRYTEAAEVYERLVRENPKDAGLRASLAGALGALGRFDDALEQLKVAIELDPLNTEAYHNRGVLYEREGKRDAAIEQYRTALRYDPQYEPARQALIRLTGSATVNQPANEAQRLAAVLAERASQEARRGDYATALKTLDEAERIAPRYALVYHYRANVRYLMGDREAAIAALRKAIELEPDNALFKTNLQRLEEAAKQ